MPTVKIVKPLTLHGLKAPPAPAAAKIAIKPIVAHVVAATGAPPAVAHVTLAKVLTLHLSPTGSPAQQAAQEDLASLQSPDAQDVAAAAQLALFQDSGFWVNFYALQAQENPLPFSHPWAGIIAQDLLAGI